MRFDEILILAVLVMLIGSMWMGFMLQRSLHHSREAFEALTREIGGMVRKVERLEERLAELERR